VSIESGDAAPGDTGPETFVQRLVQLGADCLAGGQMFNVNYLVLVSLLLFQMVKKGTSIRSNPSLSPFLQMRCLLYKHLPQTFGLKKDSALFLSIQFEAS